MGKPTNLPADVIGFLESAGEALLFDVLEFVIEQLRSGRAPTAGDVAVRAIEDQADALEDAKVGPKGKGGP